MSTAQSASMPWISWWLAIVVPPCTRVVAHCGRFLQRALGGADRASADHQALLDEPVARELVALAHRAEPVVVPDATPSSTNSGCS